MNHSILTTKNLKQIYYFLIELWHFYFYIMTYLANCMALRNRLRTGPCLRFYSKVDFVSGASRG